ncbi:MAG: PadR family transcriptional regulator [Eubacteriales bacterium]
MDISKDLIAASSTPLVLAILKNKDNYGYSIIKKVKEMSRNEIIWTEGMLYPVLHKLEKEGLIESYWKKAETGRRRKYYRIKKEGIEELDKQKKQWKVVHSTLSKEITFEEEE